MPNTVAGIPSSCPTTDRAVVCPAFERSARQQPLITIGIPAYDRPAYLAEALASIERQQGCDDFEVVVCDDGALPETRRVIESSTLGTLRYYVNRPPLGAVGNWNRCITLARGRWVTILHDDDLLYPWFLRTVVPRLRREIAAVAVRCVQGETPPALAAPGGVPVAANYFPLWFLKASMTPFPGVVFARDTALRLGAFDSRQGGLADYSFWYDLACAGRVETLRVPAAFYRVGHAQWTEHEWPTMLRRAHALRLRVAREQLADHPRLGRWIARFYTGRMARAYGRRFGRPTPTLTRAGRFQQIPLGGVPSGWVWALLKVLARRPGNALPRPVPRLAYAVPGSRPET